MISVGWGHHMICNERFHFLLPSKNATSEKIKVSIQGLLQKDANASKSSLMHAVLHSNGYGHLLHINGFEGGSDFLSGHQILDFWDRICTALQVR